MTKEFPMTNSQRTPGRAEAVLAFGFRHYLVIGISSLVISPDTGFWNSSLTARNFRFTL